MTETDLLNLLDELLALPDETEWVEFSRPIRVFLEMKIPQGGE